MTATGLNSLVNVTGIKGQPTLYHEPVLRTATRYGLGAAYRLAKSGPCHLAPYWRRWPSECVRPKPDLPNPEPPFDGDARVGLVYDHSAFTLMETYRRGLHVGGHFGTLTWMSPPERCVQLLDEF